RMSQQHRRRTTGRPTGSRVSPGSLAKRIPQGPQGNATVTPGARSCCRLKTKISCQRSANETLKGQFSAHLLQLEGDSQLLRHRGQRWREQGCSLVLPDASGSRQAYCWVCCLLEGRPDPDVRTVGIKSLLQNGDWLHRTRGLLPFLKLAL